MRLADLPRVLLEMGPGAGRRGPTGAAVGPWCRSWSGGGVALIVLCLGVYLPGLWSIPPVDRDESRFAQASRTMLESGDYIVPRIGSTPRLNKPPLIYWLQAASARVLGDGPGDDGMGEWGNGNIWVFRVPSVLCAIGAVLLTWRLGVRMFDPRAGALGAALLAVAPMVIWDAHQARADQLLLFTTTGAMFALFVCWKRAIGTSPERSEGLRSSGESSPRPLTSFGARFGPVLLLWAMVALGVLAKGPITPMIAALTALALALASRNARWLLTLRPILGLVIVGVIVGPWVYLVAERIGWQTYWTTVYEETLGRSTEARESHWGPPGYHLVLLAVLFWPGSLLTLAAFGRSWRRGFARFRLGNRPEAFLLAWVIPAWLVFEMVATKLPHYTMPMYPAIALLSGRAVCAAAANSAEVRSTVLDRLGTWIWALIGFCGLVVGMGVILIISGLPQPAGQPAPIAIRLCAVFLVVLIGAACYAVFQSRKLVRAHAIALVAMITWCWATLGWVLPSSDLLWISPRIVQAVRAVPSDPLSGRMGEPRVPPVALIGYQEDSAVFLLRGRGVKVESEDIGRWTTRFATGIVVIDPARAPQAARYCSTVFELRGTIPGYNYSTGKQVTLDVYSNRSGR